MGWTIEIVSVKSYLATTIVVLPLYFPFEKVKNEMLLSKKKNDNTLQQYPSSKNIFILTSFAFY